MGLAENRIIGFSRPNFDFEMYESKPKSILLSFELVTGELPIDGNAAKALTKTGRIASDRTNQSRGPKAPKAPNDLGTLARVISSFDTHLAV